jgi:8-oxo-dGTP diphosphatase
VNQEKSNAPERDMRPRVGVGVLLVDPEHGLLLTLRKRAPEAGCWSIVGGKVDFLEKLDQCALREAREEVGVEVKLIRLLCVTDHLLPEEGQHWVAPAYLGRIVSGEVKNCEPEKTAQVRWFALANIPENLTMTARKAIEAHLHTASAAHVGGMPDDIIVER